MSIFLKNPVLAELAKRHMDSLSEYEGLSPETIWAGLESGTMILLANKAHSGVHPVLVGQPSRVKVNANLGTSPMKSGLAEEMEKLSAAVAAGADTVMDLSVEGELDTIRSAMLQSCRLPLGTVPLYAVAQKYISSGRDAALFSEVELFEEIERQAEQGVDFMTLHCGLTRRGASWAEETGARSMGIVSRGGAILTRWMKMNDKENPLLENFDRILEIARKNNVTLSLGDGLRPGAGQDAGDTAQWEEVIMLGQLARRGLAGGVQCMVEGPGHVPLHLVEAQIRGIKAACSGAPLYVLGPLVTDVSPGYDHIGGAIGGALAVNAGADFLCYLTPAEHVTLPDIEDVRAGVMASRIAAQAGEVSRQRLHALTRERKMAEARKQLDWGAMQEAALDPAMLCQRRGEHAHEEACAMCGDFCAVKMLRC